MGWSGAKDKGQALVTNKVAFNKHLSGWTAIYLLRAVATVPYPLPSFLFPGTNPRNLLLLPPPLCTQTAGWSDCGLT